jgi:hypothetical protein
VVCERVSSYLLLTFDRAAGRMTAELKRLDGSVIDRRPTRGGVRCIPLPKSSLTLYGHQAHGRGKVCLLPLDSKMSPHAQANNRLRKEQMEEGGVV